VSGHGASIWRGLGHARAWARISAGQWTLLVVAAVVVTRLPGLFVSFFGEDEATYSALGARLAEGAIPYAGAVDHKPPGISLLYGLIYGVAGRYQLVAVRIALMAAVAATALAIGRLAVVRRDDASARIAGLVYAIASTFGAPNDTQAANTELFAALPLALAGLAVALGGARRLFAAGMLVAIATLLRYQSALVGAAFAAAVLVEGRQAWAPWRAIGLGLAALAGGFACVAAGFVLAMRSAGALDDYWFWGWNYNFVYMATLTGVEWARNASWGTLVTSVWWIPVFCVVRRPQGVLERVWLAAAIAGVIPGGRFFLHYYLALLPPLCIGAGVARMRPRALAAGGLAAVAALVLGFGWYHYEDRHAADDRAYRAVAGAVVARTAPADRIFVWGDSPEIYHYADRVMATRFAFCNYHTGRMWGSRYVDADAVGTEAFIVPRAMQQLLADLELARPALIIDGGAGRLNRYDLHPLARYPELAGWVAAHYRVAAIVQGVPIYARRADQSSSPMPSNPTRSPGGAASLRRLPR
jgi:hypothetical protein